MPAGRPTKYTPELLQQAEDYINGGYKDHGQVIPSVVGMAVALKVGKSTLYDWANDETKKFSDTLARCDEMQHVIALNKGISGEFSQPITKLVLFNHGYSEKHQQEVVTPEGVTFNMNFGNGK